MERDIIQPRIRRGVPLRIFCEQEFGIDPAYIPLLSSTDPLIVRAVDTGINRQWIKRLLDLHHTEMIELHGIRMIEENSGHDATLPLADYWESMDLDYDEIKYPDDTRYICVMVIRRDLAKPLGLNSDAARKPVSPANVSVKPPKTKDKIITGFDKLSDETVETTPILKTLYNLVRNEIPGAAVKGLPARGFGDKSLQRHLKGPIERRRAQLAARRLPERQN